MITDYFPLIEDIKNDYIKARRHGKSRREGIAYILDEYANELSDDDDGPQVWLGLAKALSDKKELTEEIKTKAEEAIEKLKKNFSEAAGDLLRFKQTVISEYKIGPESKYPKKHIYKPDWKIGDTFIHKLTGKEAFDLGIEDQNVIVIKVGESYDENVEVWFQIVLLSICKNSNIPRTSEELNKLEYLPLSKNYRFPQEGNEYNYLGYLWISSKAVEKKFKLEYLGNFLDLNPIYIDEIHNESNNRVDIYFPVKNRDFLTERVCRSFKKGYYRIHSKNTQIT